MRYALFFILIVVHFICYTGCKRYESDVSTNAVQLYKEKHRPQFHFSPQGNWMNDPNGMVFYDGEYHLFYQYYPDSTVWGPMHWGHAVSEDLMQWTHLPVALYPDELGYIFSGSAVVDWNNTSGFGINGQPPLVAIFTHHNIDGEKSGSDTFQYQSIAYSNDRGRSWTKYAGNPVIENPGIRDFRDPKVIWDKGSSQWVMVFAAKDRVRLYGSEDLKSWDYLSEFGTSYGNHKGVWECPDLFPIIDEETNVTKWILLLSINPGGPNGGSATQYFIGDFDGKNFVLDNDFKQNVENEEAVWLDYGCDNYAGVTWSDIPEEDGRRIFMGWMSNWDYAQVVPTERWRSAMTIPRELNLYKGANGWRLRSEPVKEISKIHDELITNDGSMVDKSLVLASQMDGLLIDLSTDVIINRENQKGKFYLRLSNDRGEYYDIGFDFDEKRYYGDRRNAGKMDFSDKFASDIHWTDRYDIADTSAIRILIDKSSIELFADGGKVVLTDLFFPSDDYSKLTFMAEGAKPVLGDTKIYTLRSIWE